MTRRQVILEMAYNPDIAASAFAAAATPTAAAALDTAAVPKMAHVAWDTSFAPTALPGQRQRPVRGAGYESGISFDLAPEPEASTYIVRAEVEENKLDELKKHKQLVGVFADVAIDTQMVCPGSAPVGTDADVDRLLCGPRMRSIGMDGSGVLLAIVDTGINTAWLQQRGRPISLDTSRSWVVAPGDLPGQAAVGHGTMCAFDAAIIAPRATFLDIRLLRPLTGSPLMAGMLSDAVRAYAHLMAVMTAPRRPGDPRSLVVSNSWGMFQPSWDFPVNDPRNYSDNPNHPFNRLISSLERAGADILFAAGNCGQNCPDGRCGGITTNALYGASSHPSVLSIAGVDVTHVRAGYSSQGPGRLAHNKPDLSGYTHFRGSGVYAADGGTSAATPVVAGVVAAVRSKRPFNAGNPASLPSAIRTLMRNTATDLSPSGFDFNTGFGVVGGCALYQRLRPAVVQPLPQGFCQRFPWLCERIELPPIRPPVLPPPIPPIPPIPPRPPGFFDAPAGDALGDGAAVPDNAELAQAALEMWRAGWLVPAGAASAPQAAKGCGCGGGGAD